jgi:surface polysaccharide O-acyltransferase-like enzyme
MDNQSSRNIWVDYLRATITVLVVAHHSALAYTSFSVFNKDAYILSTHAVVDNKRWFLLDYMVGFNDTFFMPLMFLIGGLFFFTTINKKGVWLFIKDKVLRLLIPFLLPGTLLMLLAYFPSFYLAKNSTNVEVYVKDFFTTEAWPVGPPWFLWLLFVFNFIAALIYRLFPAKYGLFLSGVFNEKNNFFKQFLIFFLIGLLAYLPMAGHFGPYSWTGFGPFDFQLSRLILYFAYFGVGAIVGRLSLNAGIFSNNSPVVKQYRLWCLLAIAVFTGTLFLNQVLNIQQFNNMLLVLCCTLICIALISVFSKFLAKSISWWDALSKHAYLIYLVHFVFVTWIQFWLLHFDLPVPIKFLTVFLLSFVLSWITAYLLRKIAIVKKYL